MSKRLGESEPRALMINGSLEPASTARDALTSILIFPSSTKSYWLASGSTVFFGVVRSGISCFNRPWAQVIPNAVGPLSNRSQVWVAGDVLVPDRQIGFERNDISGQQVRDDELLFG